MGKRARGQIKVQNRDSNDSLRKSSLRIIGACGIIIFVITFMIYTPALKNSFVNWDDNVYVCENSYIYSLNLPSFYWMLTAFHECNWHPLTWLSHAADYALFGLNPFGHHLTSIILHGMNTFLVFLLVILLMLKGKAMNKVPSSVSVYTSLPLQPLIAAGATALLFGIHPLHVESVAWVAERKDVLCAFFFLLTLCSYLFYTCSADKKNRRAWFAICVLLFAASLMAKPMAVTLPLVLLLLDIYPLKRITLYKGTNNLHLSVLLEKVPFFFLSLVSGVFTVMAQHAGGALESMEKLPLSFRLLNALHSLLFYLTKMIWPSGLVPFYPFLQAISFFDLTYGISSILVLSIMAGCIWLWKRGRCLFLIIWVYYLITLLPVVGIIQVGIQAAADRYTYLPSMSIFLLAGIGVSQLFAVTVSRKNMMISGGLIVVLIFILFGQLTVQQIKIWQDSETLWRHVVKRFPDRVPIAHYSLGVAYDKRGLHDKAIAEYEKAIAIDPVFEEAHNGLGISYYTMGMYDKAVVEYEKAIDINPKHDDAYYNLGLTYDRAGMYDRAVAEYEKAIAINPQNAKAYNDLGFIYNMKGMYDRAIATCERAISINPRFVQAYNNLGLIYHTKGIYDAALASYEMALSINPRYAESHHNMGLAYFAQGRNDKAIAAYERALLINPNLAQANNYLGLAYYTQGNYSMAKIYFDKALALGYKVDPKLLESIKSDH